MHHRAFLWKSVSLVWAVFIVFTYCFQTIQGPWDHIGVVDADRGPVRTCRPDPMSTYMVLWAVEVLSSTVAFGNVVLLWIPRWIIFSNGIFTPSLDPYCWQCFLKLTRQPESRISPCWIQTIEGGPLILWLVVDDLNICGPALCQEWGWLICLWSSLDHCSFCLFQDGVFDALVQ